MDHPAIYAHLLHAGKTDEPTHGRLVALTQERGTAINRAPDLLRPRVDRGG